MASFERDAMCAEIAARKERSTETATGRAVAGALAMLVGLGLPVATGLYAEHATKVSPRLKLTGFERLNFASPGVSQSSSTFSWRGARLQVDWQFDPTMGGQAPSVHIHGAYFADQYAENEMVTPENQQRIRRPLGWSSIYIRHLALEATDYAAPQIAKARVQEHLLAQGEQRRLMWVWYEIDGRRLNSESLVKAWTAWSLIRGRGDHACVWVMVTEVVALPSLSIGQTPESTARERLKAGYSQASCQ
jgi:EpsI family protein